MMPFAGNKLYFCLPRLASALCRYNIPVGLSNYVTTVVLQLLKVIIFMFPFFITEHK